MSINEIAVEIEKSFLKCKIGLTKETYSIRELENDIDNKYSFILTSYVPLSFSELSYMITLLKNKLGVNENDVYISPNSSKEDEFHIIVMVKK